MSAVRFVLTAVLLAGLLTGGPAFGGKIEKTPGYFDLEWITIPDDADTIKDIDLRASLRGLAADAKEAGDEELARVLDLIKSVRVKGFSIDYDWAEETDRAVRKAENMLKDQDWERLIYVKDDEEKVIVSTKSVDGRVVGVTALIYEPEEEVYFVNVVGSLDFATLLSLAKNWEDEDWEVVFDDYDDHDH